MENKTEKPEIKEEYDDELEIPECELLMSEFEIKVEPNESLIDVEIKSECAEESIDTLEIKTKEECIDVKSEEIDIKTETCEWENLDEDNEEEEYFKKAIIKMPLLHCRNSARQLVSPALMLRAVREVKNHDKSIRSVARDFGINYRTLTRYCKKLSTEEISNTKTAQTNEFIDQRSTTFPSSLPSALKCRVEPQPQLHGRKFARGLVSPALMLHAAREVKNHGKSIRSVARDFGINYRTLTRYCKKFTIEEISNTAVSTPFTKIGYQKNRRIFTDEEEEELEKYIRFHFGLSPKDIRRIAFEFAVSNNLKVPKSWESKKIASPDWFTSFLRRHPSLTVKTPKTNNLA